MVCKEEIFTCFKTLRSPERIEVMCGLFSMCLPLELRYFGSCVEDLCRKEYRYLKVAEHRANQYEEINKIKDFLIPEDRSKLLVSLCVLDSTNRRTTNGYFKLLQEKWKELERLPSDESALEELLAIFTLAAYHPAFTYEQKIDIHRQRSALEKMYQQCSLSSLKQEAPKDGITTNGSAYSCQPTLKSRGRVRSITLDHQKDPGDCKIQILWTKGPTTEIVKSHQELLDCYQRLVFLTSQSTAIHLDSYCSLPDSYVDGSHPEDIAQIASCLRRLFNQYPTAVVHVDLIDFLVNVNHTSAHLTNPTSPNHTANSTHHLVNNNSPNHSSHQCQTTAKENGDLTSHVESTGNGKPINNNKPVMDLHKTKMATCNVISTVTTVTTTIPSVVNVSTLCGGNKLNNPLVNGSPLHSPRASPSHVYSNNLSLEQLLRNEDLQKYNGKLSSYTLEELAALTEEELRRIGLPHGVCQKLRKVLGSHRKNGIKPGVLPSVSTNGEVSQASHVTCSTTSQSPSVPVTYANIPNGIPTPPPTTPVTHSNITNHMPAPPLLIPGTPISSYHLRAPPPPPSSPGMHLHLTNHMPVPPLPVSGSQSSTGSVASIHIDSATNSVVALSGVNNQMYLAPGGMQPPLLSPLYAINQGPHGMVSPTFIPVNLLSYGNMSHHLLHATPNPGESGMGPHNSSHSKMGAHVSKPNNSVDNSPTISEYSSPPGSPALEPQPVDGLSRSDGSSSDEKDKEDLIKPFNERKTKTVGPTSVGLERPVIWDDRLTAMASTLTGYHVRSTMEPDPNLTNLRMRNGPVTQLVNPALFKQVVMQQNHQVRNMVPPATECKKQHQHQYLIYGGANMIAQHGIAENRNGDSLEGPAPVSYLVQSSHSMPISSVIPPFTRAGRTEGYPLTTAETLHTTSAQVGHTTESFSSPSYKLSTSCSTSGCTTCTNNPPNFLYPPGYFPFPMNPMFAYPAIVPAHSSNGFMTPAYPFTTPPPNLHGNFSSDLIYPVMNQAPPPPVGFPHVPPPSYHSAQTPVPVPASVPTPANAKPMKMFCCNCGHHGHRKEECKDTSIDDDNKKGQYRLNYVPTANTES